MDYKKHLAKKMKDPDFKREYEALEPEFELLSASTSTLDARLVIHFEHREVWA